MIRTYAGSRMLEVNALLPEGSVTRVTGPSGAGKTTFLKIIAGLIVPENGTIHVGSETWLDRKSKICWSPQKRKTGFVFQDYALFPNMTVAAHLRYATRDNALVERLLSMGGMAGLATLRPGHLSGGQQQRLAILRAIATGPKILLMDEPFSALDERLRTALLAELEKLLHEFSITCLIATHHPAELNGLATHFLDIRETGPSVFGECGG
jgi:molybdate transport system ATP-binding protein